MRLPSLNTLIPSQLSNTIVDLRAQIAQTSQEAVTGRHADLTRHLNGRMGEANLSQKAISDIGMEKSIVQLGQTRLDLVQSSLSHIQDVTGGLGVRLQAAIGLVDNYAIGLAAADAKAALSQVFSALNVRHGERFLFSGDATATPPLQDPETLLTDLRTIAASSTDATSFNAAVSNYFDDPLGPWHRGVYSGSANVSDRDAVIATDPALSQLISGLAVLALASPGEGVTVVQSNPGVLGQAASVLQSAEISLTQLRSDRGVIQENSVLALENLDAEESILTQAFNALTGRDQYEAASHLRELEANLEASYLLTSRLANLSLLNFLR